MDVFNKFYSQVTNSVSSTVSQLSGVLPGNPVTREFDSLTHIASAGPGLLWKVYKGSNRTTKNEAAVFVFEKRQLERYNKNDRDIILESLRRGVQQLTKIRHPQILTVQHPLEESRESLAFATESIFASLANVLGETHNMPQPSNISDYKFYDIEIKYGLLQLAEGLAFLHNDVKMIHRNICPESVIVNSSGVWKIFGLDFCALTTTKIYEYNPVLPNVCQPNLNYLAPEGGSNASTTNPALPCDLFSLGMLIYALYSTDRQPLMPVRDLQQFRQRKLQSLSVNRLQCIPGELRDFVKLLLDVRPDLRPDAHQFIKMPFFDDIGVKTLTYLDSLLQWDNIQKSHFYKGLPAALAKLPHRVKLRRVLTCLTRDLAQLVMVPFILPSIFDIAKNCEAAEYCEYVLPHLRPLMKIVDPIQVLLIMLQNMELLLKLTPAHDIQQHVLPMLYRGLDSDSVQIHELCLTVLPTFAGLLDHSNVKNSFLPRIKRLCLSTSSLSVRVNCLLCIGKLLEHLDKWLVLDEILSFLPQIPSREPAVLMGIIGIYKIALTHKKLGITKEIIASRVLPFLIPLCIENSLTISQFNTITSLIKEMFNNIEMEHRQKLEQLNSVKDEQKTLVSSMNTSFDVDKTSNVSDWVVSSNDTRVNKGQSDSLSSNVDMLTPQVSNLTISRPQMSNTNNFPTQLSNINSSRLDVSDVNNSLSNNFPKTTSYMMPNASNLMSNDNFPQLSNMPSLPPPQMSNISSLTSQANWASPLPKNQTSLDNLLMSNINSHRSVNSQMSMNQMKLMQPQNVNNNRMTPSSNNACPNKLSNDEIMDLLS